MGLVFQDITEDSQPQDQDQEEKLLEMKSIKEFFHKFAYKIEIFDPLDRPTPNEEEDYAIKREQLVQKIEQEMPAMLGSELIVPLNNEKYRKL